jgi:hypothetical protein
MRPRGRRSTQHHREAGEFERDYYRQVNPPTAPVAGTTRCALVRGAADGMRKGVWCVGCCWVLMASLFALGVMRALWMAVVAGLITLEKTLPSRRTATYGTAFVLLTLGVLVLAAPQALPGNTLPTPDPMSMTPTG